MKLWENIREDFLFFISSFKWPRILSVSLVMFLTCLSSLHITGTLVAHHYQITVGKASTLGLVAYVVFILVLAYYLFEYLTFKRILQLIFAYLIYLALSYLFLLTEFINRPDFEPSKTLVNDFFEIRYLPTIILVFLVAALLKFVSKYQSFGLSEDFKLSPELIFSCLMVGTILCDSRLLDIILANINVRGEIGQGAIVGELITMIFPLVCYFMPISFWGLKSLADLRLNKSSLSLAIGFSLLSAVTFNYTLQLGVKGGGALLGEYVFPGATLYQILFLTILFVLIYILINRFIPATLLILTFGISASIANGLKVAMRSEPLLVTDLVWLRQLDLLLGFIDRSFVLILFLILLMVSGIYLGTRKKFFRTPIVESYLGRGFILVGLSTLIFTVYNVFRNEEHSKISPNIPVISTLNNWQDISWMGFETNARYKSLAFVWTKQLSKRLMDKPEDYSQESIFRIYNKYKLQAQLINESRAQRLSEQSVIYILSESFSDPSDISGVTLSRDVIPNIHDIKNQTTSGFMQADFYGGGTANMEFQSLTGLPLYNYNGVSTAYTEVVPKMRFFPSVSSYFESNNRTVIHPANSQNYQRYSIYRTLQFQDFWFEEKIGQREPGVGVYTSDEAVYNLILEQLEEGKNQFFSVITMQNHAPWSVEEPKDLTVSGEDLNEDETGKLLNFSRLLTYTDGATKSFLDKLSQLDQKVTVVFYGDHLPGLYPDAIFYEQPERKFMTDYFIWSNYQENKLDHSLINSSDFMALLLEHTNSEVTPYTALLTSVLQEASVDKKKMTAQGQLVADELKMIQYDISLGKSYILNHSDFFDMNE